MKKTAAMLLAMIMMLFAACALAEGPKVTTADGSSSFADGVLTIKKEGTYTISNWNDNGNPIEGRIEIEDGVSGDVTLKLENVCLEVSEDIALSWVNNQEVQKCALTVEFVNSSLKGDVGISMDNRGSGLSLNVTGENAKIIGESAGIQTFIGETDSGDVSVTVSAAGSVIEGGQVGIAAANEYGNTTVTITEQAKGAKITALEYGHGIYAYSGGDTVVTVAGDGVEIYSGYQGISATSVNETGNVTVNVTGDNVAIKGDGDGYGINASGEENGSTDVTVSGKNVKIEDGDCGISASGGTVNVTVSGENTSVAGQDYAAEVNVAGDAKVLVSGKGAKLASDMYGVYVNSADGDVDVTASGAGAQISGESCGVWLECFSGDASVNMTGKDAQITSDNNGLNVSSIEGNAAMNVSGANAAITSEGDAVYLQAGQNVDLNVTGANAKITAGEWGAGFSVFANEGSAAVNVTGAGAEIVGNEWYGMYVEADIDAAVTVKNAGKIIGGIWALSMMEGAATVTVTDVEEISGDRGIYANAYTGDVTVNAKNIGKMIGYFEGVAAESNYGNVSVNLADVQEIFGHSNGIRLQSAEGVSELTLGGNMTVTSKYEDAIVVNEGYDNDNKNGTVQLDSKNYPGIVAQVYELDTDEEPVNTLEELTAGDVAGYRMVRTVFASAAGLPGTGDNSQLMLYAALLGIAAAALLAQRGLRRE